MESAREEEPDTSCVLLPELLECAFSVLGSYADLRATGLLSRYHAQRWKRRVTCLYIHVPLAFPFYECLSVRCTPFMWHGAPGDIDIVPLDNLQVGFTGRICGRTLNQFPSLRVLVVNGAPGLHIDDLQLPALEVLAIDSYTTLLHDLAHVHWSRLRSLTLCNVPLRLRL